MDKSNFKWLVIGGVPLVLLLVISVYKSNPPRDYSIQELEARTKAEKIAKPPERKKFNTGETATVKVPGGGDLVMIATSEAAYDEVQAAYNISDNLAYGELITSGKAFLIKNGTEIKIIDRTFGKRRVRILSGDEISKSGWISKDWLD